MTLQLKMTLNRHNTKKIIGVGIFSLIALIVIGYTVFASHDLILGPSLVVSKPINGSTLTKPNVIVKGVVKRIQNISLNDRPITIDEKGNFKENVLLSQGYNAFTLIASDKFGRKKEYRLELIYKVN